MKRAYLLLFPLLPIIMVSCGKNDNGDGIQKVEGTGQNNPEVPDAVSYDLNTDSVDDFQVNYNMGIWDGANASGFLVSATLKSMNESTVLLKINEGINTEILFSMPKDSIWREPVEPFKWNEYGPVSIARLWQGTDGIWPEEWSVNSEFTSNPYYLGIGVKENEDFLVGWIKLEINVTNGKIRFVEYQLTPEEYIVIPE